ncbi:MAG: hypothetical protein WCJ40_20790 [Planctomycetota bacterium]
MPIEFADVLYNIARDKLAGFFKPSMRADFIESLEDFKGCKRIALDTSAAYFEAVTTNMPKVAIAFRPFPSDQAL